MTPEDILQELRDIHLPVDAAWQAPSALSVWPFLVFLGIVFLVFLAGFWRRTLWRREAARRLSQIDRIDDQIVRWHDTKTE